jgi:Kef-type K+ transport system membrane component KefB/nucleotide-binding universal stress UspA family protein
MGRAAALATVAGLILAQSTTGVTAPLTEHEVLVFLVQVLLLVGAARTLGTLMKRLGQPPVVGELLAGVLLGPSLFGVVFPSAHEWVFEAVPVADSATFALAWLGVVFLLVVMGYETDLDIIARFRRVALAVAAGSLFLPMIATGLLGYTVADQFAGSADPPPWVFASFFALALSVSALPVVGKILADLGFLRRNFGQITLAAAMAKDAVGWLILAVLSGIAVGGVEVSRVATSFGGLALFVLLMFSLGRWMIDGIFKFVLARGSDVTAGFSIAVVAALAGGAVTQALHLEAILGAYLVGLTLARARHQLPQVRDRLEMVTAAFFAPVFFAVSGLRVDVTALADLETALWTLAAIVVAVTAKIGGTVLSGKLAGVGTGESIALGTGLSPLGVMGVVVAIIGLNVGIINESAYTILILAAVITSLIAPIMLKWAVGRWDPPREEADRLQRESLRGGAEILGATRILLPTRGGINSIYAARLVGAVFPDAEVTVVTIKIPETRRLRWRRWSRAGSALTPDPVIEALGEGSSRLIQRVGIDPASAIIEESRLGYDLLVVGATRGDEGIPLMSTVVERVLRETGIPTVIVQFPSGEEVPAGLPQNVLVPVTASRSSRAAEELGYSMARASGGRAIALHVINRPDGEGFLLPQGVEAARSTTEGLLAEARGFAERLGVIAGTAARVAPNAEQEILDFAERNGIDLLVLGTSNRPVTNQPFFGHRISYIAEHSPMPIVIVALPSFRGSA